MLFDTDPPKVQVRDPLALIGIEEAGVAADIDAQVQSLGFRTDIIPVQRDISQALKMRNFDLIILQESYEERSISENEILLEVVGWAADRRRLRYCVLIGDSFETADEFQSFLYSMDLLVNTKHAEHFGAYLQMGLGQKQESLARFNEVSRRGDLA